MNVGRGVSETYTECRRYDGPTTSTPKGLRSSGRSVRDGTFHAFDAGDAASCQQGLPVVRRAIARTTRNRRCLEAGRPEGLADSCAKFPGQAVRPGAAGHGRAKRPPSRDTRHGSSRRTASSRVRRSADRHHQSRRACYRGADPTRRSVCANPDHRGAIRDRLEARGGIRRRAGNERRGGAMLQAGPATRPYRPRYQGGNAPAHRPAPFPERPFRRWRPRSPSRTAPKCRRSSARAASAGSGGSCPGWWRRGCRGSASAPRGSGCSSPAS
jgi:hypothetical protein